MKYGALFQRVQEESVQLTDMPEVKELANATELLEKWSKFMDLT